MKKYMEFILILFLIVLMLGCSKQENTTPTGYPSGEIDQPQIMYENKVYYYFATGFDEELPDGYSYVGMVGNVDNRNAPVDNFSGCRVVAGQKIYSDSKNARDIYIEYESGCARFSLRLEE